MQPEDLSRTTELWQEAYRDQRDGELDRAMERSQRWEVASERSTTTFVPVPIDLVACFLTARQKPLSP